MSGNPSVLARATVSKVHALTFRTTLAFYIPLALSVTILGMTRTTLNAGMGRGTADAGVQIGAFAAAVGLSWILMAFVFPVREACLTFLRGPVTYRQLRKLCFLVGIVPAGVGGLVFVGPWGAPFLEVVMGLRGELRDATLSTIQILCLSPPLLAWQRFNQGTLMWLRTTRALTWISSIKYGLLVIVVVLLLLAEVRFTSAVAAWVLNLADAAEGLLLELVVLRVRGDLRGPERPVSARTFIRYFLPLGVRELIMDCVRPVLSAALARLPEPEVALAAYGVATGLNQLFERPLFSFRHTAMALVRDAQSSALIRRFSIMAGWSVLVVVLAVTWTPAIYWICRGLLGLSPMLVEPSVWTTRIVLLEVTLQPTRAFYQGILINDLRGWVLTLSSAVRVAVAFLVGFIVGPALPLSSWTIGGLAHLLAVVGETIVVNVRGRRAARHPYGTPPVAAPARALVARDAQAD
jgi:Na+-driven multidrug efflux pump